MRRAYQHISDAQILRMVRLRARGIEVKKIAGWTGTTAQVVARLTSQVRKHDIAQSGEPWARSAYWPASDGAEPARDFA